MTNISVAQQFLMSGASFQGLHVLCFNQNLSSGKKCPNRGHLCVSRSHSCGELRKEGRKSSKKTNGRGRGGGVRQAKRVLEDERTNPFISESCEGTDDVSAVDGLVLGDPSVEC